MTPQQLWQSQAAEAPRISLDYVRHNANTLERRTRWRNSMEYGGCLFAVALAAWVGWEKFTSQPVMLAALGYLALWCLYYLYNWRRCAGAESAPHEAGVLDALRFQRRQLERQRDARRNAVRRLTPTLLPGCALMLASFFLEHDPVPWGGIGFLTGWLVVSISGTAWFMEYEARRFQRDIDALDSLAKDI
jgi:hypothetical protein